MKEEGRQTRRSQRGAIMPEYSMAIALMVLMATAAVVVLKNAVRNRGDQSIQVLHNQTPIDCTVVVTQNDKACR